MRDERKAISTRWIDEVKAEATGPPQASPPAAVKSFRLALSTVMMVVTEMNAEM